MPRCAPTKPATLSSLLLVLAACRVGEVIAVPPELPPSNYAGDHSPIVVGDASSASPALDAGPLEDDAVDASMERGDEDASSAPAADASTDQETRDACAAATCLDVPTGCEQKSYAGHTYLFCVETLTWDLARARCMAGGRDLVIIDDAAENTFVAAGLAASSWIGANDLAQEGTWTWIVAGQSQPSGMAVGYSDWASGAPDNCAGLFGQQDCARIATDGTWNDSDCEGGCLEGTFAFVCESF